MKANREKILGALKGAAARGGMTRDEIAAKVGTPKKYLDSYISKMWRAGQIKSVPFESAYYLPDEEAEYLARTRRARVA